MFLLWRLRAGVMVTLRMRLKCELFRRGSTEPEQVYEVLNEMVIDRGPNAFLTNIECYEKGRFITRVQADGIMLSTPTGASFVLLARVVTKVPVWNRAWCRYTALARTCTTPHRCET